MAKEIDLVVRRIIADITLKEHWFDEHGGKLQLRDSAVAGYLALANRFRELLLATVHFLGGQPARTTKLLGIHYTNTPNEGRRNIFIQHQMVYIAVGYHKNYTQSGQLKVVQRYLPREVGEQLV